MIEPDDGIVAIGSGGPYALAAAKALANSTDLDARADIYSMGGLGYYLLTGQPPRGGKTLVEILEQARGAAPIPHIRCRHTK